MPGRALRGPVLSRVRRTGLSGVFRLPLFFFGVLIPHFFAVPLFDLLLSWDRGVFGMSTDEDQAHDDQHDDRHHPPNGEPHDEAHDVPHGLIVLPV